MRVTYKNCLSVSCTLSLYVIFYCVNVSDELMSCCFVRNTFYLYL